MNLEIGIVAVGLARQQSFDLLALSLERQALKRRAGLGDRGLIILGLTELYECQRVVETALELAIRLDRSLQLLALPHHLLGALRIAPKLRILALAVQFAQALLGRVPVKETSGQAQAIA